MQPITIVSGLPRSGTSMLMQMLAAGGMPVLVDELRPSDEDNPRGYFEDARVKRLDRDNAWIPEARGKALKVVAPLLAHLPQGEAYHVLFIERPIEEVLRSQAAMMARKGIPQPAPEDDAALRAVFEASLERARAWMAAANARVLPIRHGDLLGGAAGEAARIAEFLGGALDVDAMAAVVDATLYRNRG